MNLLLTSLGLSLISGLISAVALYIGLARLRTATQRIELAEKKTDITLRKQLTDMLDKLILVDANELWLQSVPSRQRDDLLESRQRFLLKRAQAIVDKIADQVDPYEYLIFAGMLASIGEVVRAEQLFRHAIKYSVDMDKAIACRDFAGYLFSVGRCTEGREQYTDAIKLLSEAGDQSRTRRTNVLERWAQDEEHWGNTQNASMLLVRASDEIASLAHPQLREQEKARLDRVLVSAG